MVTVETKPLEERNPVLERKMKLYGPRPRSPKNMSQSKHFLLASLNPFLAFGLP